MVMHVAKEIDYETTVKIIQLYLNGDSYADVSKTTDVSKGSISSIVKDFTEGRGIEPESGLLSEEIRSIAGMMKEKNLSIAEMQRRIIAGDIVFRTGFSSETLVKIVSKLKGKPESEIDQYPRVLGQMLVLEKEKGIRIDEIEDHIATKTVELQDVTNRIEKAQKELSELRDKVKEEDERLSVLSSLNEFLGKVKETIETSNPKTIVEILKNLKESGFDAGLYLDAYEVLKLVRKHKTTHAEENI